MPNRAQLCPLRSAFNLSRPKVAFLLAATIIAGAQLAVAQSAQTWPFSGFDITNSHWNATESTLGASNANTLVERWAFTTQNDVSAIPAVDAVGNAVYFPDWSGNLYKLNASTGAVIWSQQLPNYGLPSDFISRSTPTLSGSMLIMGASTTVGYPNYTAGAYIIAVDSASGNLLWQVQVDSTELAVITGSPVVYNGVIYIGVSSGQEKLTTPTFRGSVVALSQVTGQVLWQTYMVPSGYTGAAIWSSTPAIDVSRNQLYVTTGQNYGVPASVEACEVAAGSNSAAILVCQAPNNYEDAIVALNLTTGAINWGTKCATADAWNGSCSTGGSACPIPTGADYDFGSGANFFTANINGVPTDLVGAGQKSGTYWALDPDTGSVVWKQVVGPGSKGGGIVWGTATDGQRVYVAISNSSRTSYMLQPSGSVWNGGSWAALNAATGAFIWQVADPGLDPIKIGAPALAVGPVTTANGVVYVADTAGLMFALNASSGYTLWSFQAPGSVNNAPAIINGTLYWGTGYHNFPAGAPYGTASNEFYSFGLPPLPATSIQLGSSLNPANVGQSVTLTATVTPATATGTATFFDGSTGLGSKAVSSGAATLSTAALAAGSHSLTAAYRGDANDAPSTSAVLTEVINAVLNPTTTTLNASPNPATPGQTVNLTATVSPATAGGSITFFDGVTLLGSAALVQGTASMSAGFSAGSHPLTASYSGDANDRASTSGIFNESVALNISSTSLNLSTSSSTFGQNISLTAAVSPSSATGTATFYDGITVLGRVPIVSGQCSLSTSQLAARPHSLRASYSGDTMDTSSVSPVSSYTVNAVAANGFGSPATYGGLNGPLAIAAGDVNGDGIADLAVANYGNQNVAVWLGNGNGTFSGPVYFGTGIGGDSIAINDFNGDGKPDIAVANQSGSSVAILLGNGDGTFQAPVSYSSVNAPSAVAVADFNLDGIADLATASAAGNAISVLLGNGNGTFQSALTYNAGSQPYSLTVGDFNGDSKPDIAIASYGANSVNILLGNGNGTFQSAVTYNVGAPPESILAADFNGDGKTDLATANRSTSSVSVLLGNGDGTFQPAAQYTAGSGSAYAISVGDFDGNGTLDLALADQANNAVDILFGKGDGTFAAGPANATGNTPQSISVGEFNGDGRTDLAVVNQAGNSVTVLLGALLPATSTSLSSGPNPSTAGQLVTLSAVVIPATATGSVSFLDGSTLLGSGVLGGGVATFGISTLAPGSHSLTATYTGDATDASSDSASITQIVVPVLTTTTTTLNASPNPSIAGGSVSLTASIAPSTATGTVTFLQGTVTLGTAPVNNGVASLTTPFAAGTYLLTATYSGDANDQSGTSNTVTQVVNLPSSASSLNESSSANPSTFGQSVTLTATVSPSAATGHVTFYDGSTVLEVEPVVSGKAVLITATLASGVRSLRFYYSGDANYAPSSSNISQTVNAVAANGFKNAVAYGSLNVPYSAAVADVNGDGNADVVVADFGAGNAAVFLGKGDGTFASPLFTAAGTTPVSVVTGDFNEDGIPDLALATAGGNSVAIALGNGDGTFQSPATYPVGSYPSWVSVGDFNGDGIADIVTANLSGNSISILLGNANGTFQPAVSYPAGASPYSVAVGDFNGDGYPDLAIASHFDAHVYLLLGNGNGTFQAPTAISVAAVPEMLITGDFNSDGKLDLATANVSGSSVSILIGNGNGAFASAVSYTAGSGTAAGLTLGDFNGDGKPDLAIADPAGNSLDILYGNGDGTFYAGGTFATANGPVFPTAGEFNNDARTDLLSVNQNGNSVSVLLGSATTNPTTTTLVSSVNPSVFGQPISFTATVSPATATGRVVFYSGTAAMGTGTLEGGSATFTAPTLLAGAHSVKATYDGDTFDKPSTSAVITQTVSKATPVVTLSPSANPVTFGQSLTLIATVTPSYATGKVTFSNGSATLGAATLSGGVATFSTSGLAVGTHSLTAVYGGDANDNSGTSTALTETVSRSPTVTTLVSSPDPSTFGQSVTFTATVSPSSATGTVTFKNGANPIGAATLANGVASLSFAGLSVGAHSVTATYSGSTNYAPSTSSPVTQTVSAVATTVGLTSSANPSVSGQTVTFTATVMPSAAAGTITFKDGSKAIGQATLVNGTASLAISALPVGVNPITASYSGSTDYAPVTSAVVSQTVNK
jgi:outer membrane protein assembly factor BamB